MSDKVMSEKSKKDTLPPSFPVEKGDEDIREHIKRLVTPIFEAALKETLPDSMTTIQPSFKYLWRPHNYRRQIKVKGWFDSGYDNLKSAILSASSSEKGVNVGWNFNSRLKTVSIKGLYDNITLQLGRNTLVGIWKQNIVAGHKETFLLESKSFQDIEDWLVNKRKVIMDKLDLSLFDFATKSSLLQPGEQPIWGRYEDWLKGEDYIDKLPRECIIHDTIFKKVYQEGLEFKGGKGDVPIVHMKNYIKNRSLEDFSPLIAEALNGVAEGITIMRKEALEPLTEQIKLHLAVQEATLKALEGVNAGIRELGREKQDKPQNRRERGFSSELEGLRWKRIIP